ncbi:unnamed protein product [Prorocentrum cordatum]|uniref:DUF4326 domain-containing protein n=1 Tax=Prorocentrum cordatum TaxID=2364126 RepID=A0ABN9SLW5_9DINO|nr:unnamed protein product [Polarella glacialis]
MHMTKGRGPGAVARASPAGPGPHGRWPAGGAAEARRFAPVPAWEEESAIVGRVVLVNITVFLFMSVVTGHFTESAIIGRVVLVCATVFVVMSVVTVRYTESAIISRVVLVNVTASGSAVARGLGYAQEWHTGAGFAGFADAARPAWAHAPCRQQPPSPRYEGHMATHGSLAVWHDTQSLQDGLGGSFSGMRHSWQFDAVGECAAAGEGLRAVPPRPLSATSCGTPPRTPLRARPPEGPPAAPCRAPPGGAWAPPPPEPPPGRHAAGPAEPRAGAPSGLEVQLWQMLQQLQAERDSLAREVLDERAAKLQRSHEEDMQRLGARAEEVRKAHVQEETRIMDELSKSRLDYRALEEHSQQLAAALARAEARLERVERAVAPTAGSCSVRLSFTLHNLDLGSLRADAELLAAFEARLKQAVAAEAGERASKDHVALALPLAYPGLVQAVVHPRPGADAAAMAQRLRSSAQLPRALAASLQALEGLDRVSTGPICAGDVSILLSLEAFSALLGMSDSGSGPPPPAWEPIQQASLALALNGQLWEVRELCYLLALARQHAWRALLTPGERAVLLEQARHLTARLATLAGLADEAGGAPADADAAAAEVPRRQAGAEATPKGARELQQVAPARGPPAAAPGGDAPRAPPGAAAGVGAALVGALAALPAPGVRPPPGAPPAPGPLALPGAAAAGGGGGGMAAAAGPAPAGGGAVALARLAGGPWMGSPALQHGAFTAGMVLETPAHDPAGQVDGTARATRLVGRGERHADWLRLRSARSLVEPRQSRSEGGERAAGDQLDFRDAPSRGNAIQAVADGRPGTLHDEAIAQIARVMGLREGADGQRARPRIRGYLQAAVFGHHPIHSVGERTVRELQTLAAALDLLEDGSLASVADTLMQRFKALEMALNDGNWHIANELGVVEGIRPTLASRDEQESARGSATLRRRLEEAEPALAEPRRPRARLPAGRPAGTAPGAAAAPGRVELLDAPEVRAFRQDQPAAQHWRRGRALLMMHVRRRALWAQLELEKAGAAAESFRRPLDAGPILEELMREFPGSPGVYVDNVICSRYPARSFEASDFTVEEKIDPGDLTSLQSRLRVIVMAMNWEAGYRHLKWADVCGPEPNAAQRSALLGIARRVYSSVAPEPVMAGALDWSEKLKDQAIAHDVSEVSTPSRITLEQIEGGLPPAGAAASIEAADLATGFEWELVVSALFARGMVGPIHEAEIATETGVHDAPVRCSHGEERPALRPIVNMIPANACQRTIAGDTPVTPTTGQLNGPALAPGEQLLWSGAGRKAFFYVFRAPPARRPYTALGPPVPRRLVGGSGDGLTRIALRVVGMGWVSAVGVAAHLHRNMLRREAATPKGTIPELLSRASACYEEAKSPGSPGKDVLRAQQVSTLEDLVDGEAGVRRPPLGHATELTSLTRRFRAQGRPSRRLAQILLGRWVRVQCYRRPLAAAFVNAWKWLASGRSGGPITVGVAEDLLIAAALAPLSVAGMRLTVDHLATASDASEAAGAIVYSQGLSDMGRALGARGPRALDPACEEAVALISVFSGIDGARRTFEILGRAPAAHQSFEVDAEAARVARRAPPSTVHLGDVTAADPAHLARLLRDHGRIAKVIVIGGVPCQGYMVLNVAREGSADSRSQLVGHMWRLIEGLKRGLPEATVDFLGENPASTAEDEVLALNKMFGRVPVSLDAADLGRVRRPRLQWPSWDLLPSFEMTAEMTAAADGAQPRACRVRLVTELPPVSEWLPRGASWPGAAEGGRLSTFARWTPRSSPRPRPAGLRRCTPKEVARWTAAGYAAPPYQFRDCFCLHWADGRKEPPRAVEREVLMGFRRGRGHAADNLHLLEEAGRAPAAGAGPEVRAIYVGRGSRRWGPGPSKWGNPYPVVPGRPAGDAVALFAGWLRSQPELLDQLGELEGARLLCHCPSEQPCHADVLLAELEQRGKGTRSVVASLVMTCHHSGADLRVDTDAETHGKMSPRPEIDAGIWKWKVARQLVWQDQAKHINMLECEAALMARRWRARSVSRQMCVFLHLLDSTVDIGALAKRRSSSQQLYKVARAFSIPELALGSRAVFAFTSSAKNPADAPSRLPNG